MKRRILNLLLFLFLPATSLLCSVASFDTSIKALSQDDDECYRWNALHNPDLLKVQEEELWAYLDKMSKEIATTKESTRLIEVALFIASENGYLMDSSQVQTWAEIVLDANERDLSDQLINEVVANLVRSGLDAETKEKLLFSENAKLRENTFSYISLYGDEQTRAKLYERYNSLEEDYRHRSKEALELMQSDFEQGERLIQEINRQRKTNLFAYKELRDYMHYKSNGVAQGLSGAELLEWMGQHLVHGIASTSNNVYGGGGAYLWPSLTNLYWINRLSDALEDTTNREERLELEQAYRDGFYQSQPKNLRHGIRLFYLLGFELTAEEKEYLLNETGLSESALLPSGKIHLNGNGVEITTTSSEVVEVAETVEVTAPEPAIEEEPAEVAVADPVQEDVEQSSNWWLWLIGLLVAVGGLAVVVRRKS